MIKEYIEIPGGYWETDSTFDGEFEYVLLEKGN